MKSMYSTDHQLSPYLSILLPKAALGMFIVNVICCRWVAFPDIRAGTDHYTVSHDPPRYGSEFGVVNIQNVPVEITLTYTGRATPNLPGTSFQLEAGDILQIQVLYCLKSIYLI